MGLGIIDGQIGDICLWDLVNKGNLKDFVTLRNIPHTLFRRYLTLGFEVCSGTLSSHWKYDFLG